MSRRSTAIHEAGHAVIGWVLGMTCGQATIAANAAENEAGHAITHDPFRILEDWWSRGKYRGNDEMHSIMVRVLTYMAGAESERVILGRCRGGDGDDRYQIMRMVHSRDFKFSVDSWPSVELRLRAHTRALVRRHRLAIEGVASELLRRTTLSGLEIDAIVTRVP